MDLYKLTLIGNSIKNKPIIKIKRVYNLKLEKHKLKHYVVPTFKSLPDKIDLRNKFGPIYNQGSLGSCTANAFCGLLWFKRPKFMGSRLFLYYNERKLENEINYTMVLGL